MIEPCRVLVADCPWKFGDSLPGKGRGASKHYGCLTPSEIMRFPLPPLADDCILFLWRVASMQQEALDVAHAWGFTIKSEIVWRKNRIGMGRYVRNKHETCLIGRRGKMLDRLDKRVPSVFDAPVGKHSAKPDEFYDIVERLYAGPYCELFARRHREGWTCFGDELEAA